MSDQARREATEYFRIDRLFQSAFRQVIIVVETDTENLWRYGYRRQQSDSAQVDCRRLAQTPAGAQQVRALCNQLGQRAWKIAVTLGEAMPARAFIHGNSGYVTGVEMSDSHESSAVRADEPSVLAALEWRHPPDGLPTPASGSRAVKRHDLPGTYSQHTLHAPGHVTLMRESYIERDIRHGMLATQDELPGSLDTTLHDVTVNGKSDRVPE